MRILGRLKLSVMVVAAVSWTGCRGVEPRLAAESRGVGENQSPEVVSPAAPAKPVAFSDMSLWQRLAGETQGGSRRSGIVRCGSDQGYVSCYVQPNNGAETLIENAGSAWIRQRLIESRKDLEAESRVMSEVECDILGDQTPPFKSDKDARCRHSAVRAFNEAYVVDDAAFELAASLRGENILGDTQTELSGVISCRVLQRKISAACTSRRIARGGISDDPRELPRKESLRISELMMDALNEIRKAQEQQPLSVPPSELAGAARCLVDGKDLEAKGSRDSVCLIRM